MLARVAHVALLLRDMGRSKPVRRGNLTSRPAVLTHPGETAMRTCVTFLPFFALAIIAAAITIACGGGSSRQLQSITISATRNGSEVSFVAAGTYSAPPATVNPLPVSWGLDGGIGQYALTTQPFRVSCNAPGGPVQAIAPADPHAPSSGSVASTKMVTASASDLCQ